MCMGERLQGGQFAKINCQLLAQMTPTPTRYYTTFCFQLALKITTLVTDQ